MPWSELVQGRSQYSLGTGGAHVSVQFQQWLAVWPWASPSSVLHVWLSSLALKKIFFPLCDCLGIWQLSRNKRQLFSDEAQARHSCPFFWAGTTQGSPQPWVGQADLSTSGVQGSRTGWGLCSCARNMAAVGRRRFVMGAQGPWDLQALPIPFGTGCSEEFLMTRFGDVSRL